MNMNNLPNADSVSQRLNQAHEVDFNKFLRKPEVKMLLTLMPPSEPPELLTTLLRTAFEAGSASGTGVLVSDIVQALVSDKKKPS